MIKDYLYDKAFLKQLDLERNKTQYIKITVLDWEDFPIQSINGYTTGGNLNLNGNSSIRRTGSLSMISIDSAYSITDIRNIVSINKRIKVEIGFLNQTGSYREHNIFWFNQGIYIIGDANISKGTDGINISLNLKDKMVLLNGECGGMYMHEATLSPVILEDGSEEPALIKDLIVTAVAEMGGIPRHKIYVFDIPDRIKNAVRWTGNTPLYIKEETAGYCDFSTIAQSDSGWGVYPYNSNIGSRFTNFTFPTEKELIINAGETVVTLLDKIKGVLGNYEYFFDLEGNFIFQQIKDYVNEGSSLDNLTDAINDKYLINSSQTNKSQYILENELLTNISNSPVYANIKNDIVLWGSQKTSTGATKDICYHLVIDDKPQGSWKYEWVHFYKNETEDFWRAEKAKEEIPSQNTYEKFYTSDWRSKVYFDFIINDEKNYLSTEIAEFWPRVYNIKENRFNNIDIDTSIFGETYLDMDELWFNNLPYFIDMLDTKVVKGPIQDIAISKIGRRPKVEKNGDVNCLMSPRYPEIIYIEAGRGEKTKAEREEAVDNNEPYVQFPSSMMKSVQLGAYLYPAYDAIRAMLHETSGYNETINISCIPIYHLEPNTRITVKDADTGIDGDYLIQSISLPLDCNGTSTITAKKAIEKI